MRPRSLAMNRKIVKIKRRLLVPYVVIKERATILLSITNTANSKEKKKKKKEKKVG